MSTREKQATPKAAFVFLVPLENEQPAQQAVKRVSAGSDVYKRQVLNLQGCTLDMVLYYPDREIPVLAVMQDGSAVLVIGFNEQNVVLMDPLTGTVYKKGMNDARSMFEENVNRFIAYS